MTNSLEERIKKDITEGIKREEENLFERIVLDGVVHKIAMPIPKQGFLNDLILCWNRSGGAADLDLATQIKFSININEVNCDACWEIWRG